MVQKISRESYWQLVETLKRNNKAKITLNFSGCLLEHLYNIGEENLIEEFKQLAANKQIELVGSARYHPILPLLPSNEIKRQITLNDQILKQAFDEYYQPTGFFLPEMAYNFKAAKVIKELGYKWIIIDEIACKGRLGLVDYNKKYKIKGLDLNIVFRNRSLSNTFVPQTILEFTQKSNPPTYLVSATDGEMYGHHHDDKKNLFEEAINNPHIMMLTVSEYIKELSSKPELISPMSSSWETTTQELKRKVSFALWQDPKNKIHQNLWELRKIAIRLINKSREQGINYDWARHHLDRGLSSCAWWWAAEKKIGSFNFLTWNPDTIEKGLREIISSIRSLNNVSQKTKLSAEKYYHLLIKEIWKKHWKKYHKIENNSKKIPSEIKKSLSLFNQNFLILLFEKKLPKDLLGENKIDYIAIKIFKKKTGQVSFYHIVNRYTLYFKNSQTKPITLFCNANSRESRQGAFLALRYLWKNNFANGNLKCPRPLFYNKRLKAMFYLQGKGDNLYQYIINQKSTFEEIKDIVVLTSKWLAKLHSLPTLGLINFNSVQSKVSTVLPGPKNFLKGISEKHQQYPKYYQQTKDLFEKINGLEKKIGNKEKYIIHGDFHPENIVYNKKNNVLTVIDYTDCCLADFMRDLGNFYQQLGYMSKKHLPQNKIEELQKLFIDSYLKFREIKLSPEDKKRFELYKAWTALRSAIFFLTVTTFDRPRADALFEEVRSYLKKLESI